MATDGIPMVRALWDLRRTTTLQRLRALRRGLLSVQNSRNGPSWPISHFEGSAAIFQMAAACVVQLSHQMGGTIWSLMVDNEYGEFPMDKNEVIATLRAYEPELKAAGIAHLALHGSVVRGEAGPESDVDLLYEFDRAVSLIGFEGIRNLISDILGGAPVDLADRHRLRDHVRPNAEREAELVF